MSRPLRFLLLLISLLLLCCATVSLLYAFWPLESALLQATIVPALPLP
ncbi:MAG: hypothetical protein ACOYYS_00890 [Chloroflexota bacterium]